MSREEVGLPVSKMAKINGKIMLRVSFKENATPRTGAPDPKRAFTSRAEQRQLTERCGRSERLLNANCSALAAFGVPSEERQQSGALRPSSRGPGCLAAFLTEEQLLSNRWRRSTLSQHPSNAVGSHLEFEPA